MEQNKPSINPEYVDFIYLNMSKAINIFARRYELKFEEIDVILHRLEEEWTQKKMDLYFRYCMDMYKENVKKPDDSHYIK